MTTIPPSSRNHHKPLHNFSLPFLNWGQKPSSNRRNRFPTTSRSADVITTRRRHLPTKPTSRKRTHRDDDVTYRANHHKTDDDVTHRDDDVINDKLVDVDVAAAVDVEQKPWKLRPRKSVTEVKGNGGDGGGGVGERSSGRLLRTVEVVSAEVAVPAAEEEDREKMMKRRLWISLSKDEIERDILMLTGAKPNRRPKKRNKIAQKHLDNVFPGMYLVGMSADSYRL